MNLRLDALTLADCETARVWRNDALETLRTPYHLTSDQQAQFYQDVVCNRHSPHRYYAIRTTDDWGTKISKRDLVAMGGLTNIQFENGVAEISLIVAPTLHGNGFGRDSVRLLVSHAFDQLRLRKVRGEVYGCNEAKDFWLKLAHDFVMEPDCKQWAGLSHPSYYFWWLAERWRKGEQV